MNKIKITERGWPGHFIGAAKCLFRRNTLIEYKSVKIVVSTVGLYLDDQLQPIEIGYKRYYETMAFYSDPNDHKYHDANITNPYEFNSEWTLEEVDDNKANQMHEKVVKEIKNKLIKNI